MSIKSRTIKAVKDAATEYAKAAGKVADINKNELLSTAGKFHEARQIDDQFQAYIEKASQEYSSFMIEAIKTVGQAEAKEQAKRYQDPGYNQALNSVIQQIPYTVGAVSTQDMKERLAMFENDSFAAGMIRKALEGAGYEIGDIRKVMPTNTRGMASEILKAVSDQTIHYMNRAMDELRAETAKAATTYPVGHQFLHEAYGVTVDSYIAYLDGLNEDVTAFTSPDYENGEDGSLHPAAMARMATHDFLGSITEKYQQSGAEGEG